MQACDELKKRVLRFIGVVKTEIRGLCMEKSSEIELARRGLWRGYFYLDNKKRLDKFAFVWVDRYWGYFIYNTPSLKPGVPYAGKGLYRWMIVPMQIQFVLSLRSINQGLMKEIIPEIQRLTRATERGKMISNLIGSFRPTIEVLNLILHSLV